jgi:N-acetylglutamate synthase-like GNAT family acetyltransferase
LFVDSIAVIADLQQKGVGKLLFVKVMQHASEKGYVGIRLLTNKHLESYKWYNSMNFKESGWVEVYKEL